MDDLFAPENIRSVSDFVGSMKRQLEENTPVWVLGEISGFTRAVSGHWYFVLRDEQAQVDCVMLARDNRAVAVTPVNGDEVSLLGRPTLYAPRGRFQLTARFLRFSGAGILYQQFFHRKQQWAQRGWFEQARKNQPPSLPVCIGVVCSLEGAAVRDVLQTLKARYPLATAVLYPAPAQGSDAAAKIAAAIATAARRRECDVLLVCRGGGGIEDLWAYNEEEVVRAIVDCSIPVITGIGHESDETLADYAADVRASTPTAAAALATADVNVLMEQMQSQLGQIRRWTKATTDEHTQRLDWSLRAVAAPTRLLALKIAQWRLSATALTTAATFQQQELLRRLTVCSATLRTPPTAAAATRLNDGIRRLSQAASLYRRQVTDALDAGQAALELLSPQQTLARGYSVVCDDDGHTITNAASLTPSSRLRLTFHHGMATATVTGIHNDDE